MEPQLDWARLGTAVRNRRNALGMRQEDVSEAGGPSHATLRRLENGDPGPYQERTLTKLEQVFGWKNGVVRALLEGSAGDNPDEWVADITRTLEALQDKASLLGAAFRGQFQPPDGTNRQTTATAPLARVTAATGQHTTDRVSVIVRSGQAFIDDVDHHYGPDDEGAVTVKRAVRRFIHDVLIDDLDDTPAGTG